MHGTDWEGQDLAGWWASEKLDGWRAYWSGEDFYTRQGNRLNAPAWFKAGMPARALDGELWAGRGTTHDQVAAAILSDHWERLTYCPFDVPELGYKTEAAQALLASLPLPPHVRPVVYTRLESTGQALRLMWQIVLDGGEGVMARKAKAGYCPNYRTEKLLKLKPEIVGMMQPLQGCGVRATGYPG